MNQVSHDQAEWCSILVIVTGSLKYSSLLNSDVFEFMVDYMYNFLA